MSLRELQADVDKLRRGGKLTAAIKNVDRLIEMLETAKAEAAEANDPHTSSLALARLQNPISAQLEAINGDLGRVHKSQNVFYKALGKATQKTKGSLPTDQDPMAGHTALINRAIAMHLLREGQFGVASTFIAEAQPQTDTSPEQHERNRPPPSIILSQPDESPDAMITDADIPADDLTAAQSQQLQARFADMYSILAQLRERNLHPAIAWAQDNADELEARGSNLEFELCKLQYIWLFKGTSSDQLPLPNGNGNGPRLCQPNGLADALTYAQANFSRFQERHLREIKRLSCALLFAPNLGVSPYNFLFNTEAAFEEVAASFTREFCSLMGLSAESPLYVAATAGAIALPQFVKFRARARNTEWTADEELPYPTPLPATMMYHSIIVCPVTKCQTTDANPPVRLGCGHIIAKESLTRIVRNHKYKCPYCPSEGPVKDVRELVIM
ncbi:CTLH/CRA C-terminal to lish motif domain-containing protein [Astrocystis sublimbata]|nr:CTLH/CRA C-terminal to lish motif domain-containing protein [Astrocystis sublimbata]